MSAISAISSMLLPHSLSVLKPESMAFLESPDRLGMQMITLSSLANGPFIDFRHLRDWFKV